MRRLLALTLLPLAACEIAGEDLLERGGPQPLGVRFELENRTGSPVALRVNPAGDVYKDWATVRDSTGAVARALPWCAADCAVSSTPPICPPTLPPEEIVDLAEGAVRAAQWEGRVFRAEGRCYKQQPITERSLEVELCWGYRGRGANYVEAGCVTKRFQLGEDAVVRHVIEPPAFSARFEILNDTTQPVFVQNNASCSASAGYLQLWLGEEPILIQRDCGVCVCGTEPCAVCDAACLPATATELEPGQRFGLDWDGSYLIQKPAGFGAPTCFSPQVVAGESFHVDLCWGTGVTDMDGGQLVTGRRCGRTTFAAVGRVEITWPAAREP